MLIINSILKESKGKGIGLFANELINKDQLVWILEPLFHKVISEEEYKNCSKLQKEYLNIYSTYHACGVNGYFLDLDNTRFINHSENPNILFDENKGIALKNIQIGEEIFCDYKYLSKAECEKELGFTPN